MTLCCFRVSRVTLQSMRLLKSISRGCDYCGAEKNSYWFEFIGLYDDVRGRHDNGFTAQKDY